MASSWVEIANNALTRIGEENIMSFDDNLKQARITKNRYGFVRDIVLRMHPWNCASKRLILSYDETAPAFGYSRQFSFPSDLLRIIRIDGDSAYEIEGRKILSNESAINLSYVYRVEDVTILDVLCAECISAYLAFDVAQIIAQAPQMQQGLKKQFDELMTYAKTIDSQEQDTPQMVLDHYENTRNSGSSMVFS